MRATSSGIRGKSTPSQENPTSSSKRSQEEIFITMEAKVARGESVLGGAEALEFMGNMLKEIATSLYPFWETPRSFLFCDRVPWEENGTITWDCDSLGLLMHIGYHGSFPGSSIPVIEHMLFSMDVIPWDQLLPLLGACAGLLPLTEEETIHRDKLNGLLEDYLSWDEYPLGEDASLIQRRNSLGVWLSNLNTEIWAEIKSLLHFGEDDMFFTIEEEETYSITWPVLQHLGDTGWKGMREIYGEFMEGVTERAVRGEMRDLGERGDGDVLSTLNEYLSLQDKISPQGMHALSQLVEKINEESRGGVAPGASIALTVTQHLRSLTWEQVICLGSLVQEYNPEWALAAMEWDTPLRRGRTSTVEVVGGDSEDEQG